MRDARARARCPGCASMRSDKMKDMASHAPSTVRIPDNLHRMAPQATVSVSLADTFVGMASQVPRSVRARFAASARTDEVSGGANCDDGARQPNQLSSLGIDGGGGSVGAVAISSAGLVHATESVSFGA